MSLVEYLSDLRFLLVQLNKQATKIYQNMKIQKRPNRAETKSDLDNRSKQRLVSKLRNIIFPNINDNRDRIGTFRKMTTGAPASVGGDNLAWDIIIPKLDFQSQMKISQLNQRLADFVGLNAESELRKFKRHIRENKYMLVTIK